MILIIDNYDSFTYNLYQYIGELNTNVEVVRNNSISVKEIESMGPERIILSPGPKTPDDAGICIDVVKTLGHKIPILGICLGHQCIGRAYGGIVSYAQKIMHGKRSQIHHYGGALFEGIDEHFTAARYHSLSISRDNFPQELIITAVAEEDREIMGVRHAQYPVFGLQFHPESIYTRDGKILLSNFLKTSREGSAFNC